MRTRPPALLIIAFAVVTIPVRGAEFFGRYTGEIMFCPGTVQISSPDVREWACFGKEQSAWVAMSNQADHQATSRANEKTAEVRAELEAKIAALSAEVKALNAALVDALSRLKPFEDAERTNPAKP